MVFIVKRENNKKITSDYIMSSHFFKMWYESKYQDLLDTRFFIVKL